MKDRNNEMERLVKQLVKVESLMDKATGRAAARWTFADKPSYKTPLMWEPVVVWGDDGVGRHYESVEQFLDANKNN